MGQEQPGTFQGKERPVQIPDDRAQLEREGDSEPARQAAAQRLEVDRPRDAT